MSVQFDKKLAELDAYLQMLIEESEILDKKISDVISESEREGLYLIKKNLETLLGSIKRAIVLLQIAKVSIKTDDDSTSNSRNTKVSHKQRNITGKKAAIATSASKSKSVSSGPRTDISTAPDFESSWCGSIYETSDSTGDSELSQINPTSSPQPPARLSRRRSQQQKSPATGEGNNDSRFSQQQTLDAKQRRLKLSSGSSESASLELSRSVASTFEANKALSQYRGSDDLNVIRESASAVEHELNAHNGSQAIDKSLTGKSVKTHAVYEFEHGDEDDDDDAFFDAADEQHNHIQQQQFYQDQTYAKNTIKSSIKDPDPNIIETNLSSNNEKSHIENSTRIMSDSGQDLSNNNNNNNIIPDESINWDLLYEEEDEEDLGSLEGQGSVIKHLLSQIRIGMDLTKVVLPTFILERRSLLEMYADFFAHPDLFSSIPDYETPEERMVQVVRWYLSAFHAGRKSSVAKKPYNPILGEIFLCHWKLDSEEQNRPQDDNPLQEQQNVNNKKSVDGQEQGECEDERSNSVESTSSSSSDIEKFSKSLPENSLLFVAEQVSHHPPVSAFYAENREQRITCCAHIYTKSKYLGLSVGVHNIGQGEIKLLQHNETYVCTFPSAYGRSILTVPWVELGGSVNISCEQTGYSAKLEFVTKPFYGGKKHRVIGEILRPNNEPFLSIDGEWNGCMYGKSQPNSSEKKVFVDTTRLPVIKKHVRPVTVQESFESRNVWKEVTRALKLRDVTTATAAKSYIEQRQRDLLKDRTEKGQKWKTRFFEAVDNGWDYTKRLPRD